MNNVFGAYGIEVNPRHLSLTADYMTSTGKISPFNRTTMAFSPSPLQKMTFETTSTFLRDAILHGNFLIFLSIIFLRLQRHFFNRIKIDLISRNYIVFHEIVQDFFL